MVFYLGLKLQDLKIVMTFLRRSFYRMKFWFYKRILRYINYVFFYIFYPVFRELGIFGFKVRLKGKISVAGNARTRTSEVNIGSISFSSKSQSMRYEKIIIRTFTGALGLQI